MDGVSQARAKVMVKCRKYSFSNGAQKLKNLILNMNTVALKCFGYNELDFWMMLRDAWTNECTQMDKMLDSLYQAKLCTGLNHFIL